MHESICPLISGSVSGGNNGEKKKKKPNWYNWI